MGPNDDVISDMVSGMIEGVFSVIDMLRARKKARTIGKRNAFMRDAIGTVSCLVPETAIGDFVTRDSVERRVRIAQQQKPNKAKEGKIPAINDPHRREKLQVILQDMAED